MCPPAPPPLRLALLLSLIGFACFAEGAKVGTRARVERLKGRPRRTNVKSGATPKTDDNPVAPEKGVLAAAAVVRGKQRRFLVRLERRRAAKALQERVRGELSDMAKMALSLGVGLGAGLYGIGALDPSPKDASAGSSRNSAPAAVEQQHKCDYDAYDLTGPGDRWCFPFRDVPQVDFTAEIRKRGRPATSAAVVGDSGAVVKSSSPNADPKLSKYLTAKVSGDPERDSFEQLKRDFAARDSQAAAANAKQMRFTRESAVAPFERAWNSLVFPTVVGVMGFAAVNAKKSGFNFSDVIGDFPPAGAGGDFVGSVNFPFPNSFESLSKGISGGFENLSQNWRGFRNGLPLRVRSELRGIEDNLRRTRALASVVVNAVDKLVLSPVLTPISDRFEAEAQKREGEAILVAREKKKQRLFDQIRNDSVTREDVVEMVNELIQMTRPQEMPTLNLAGRWQLEYSTGSGFNLNSLFKTTVIQEIDLSAKRLVNTIGQQGGGPVQVVSEARLQLEGPNRIQFAFEKTGAEIGGQMVPVPKNIGGVFLPLPVQGEGWSDTLYVDPDLRIGLSNEGDIRIYSRL